ncbi:MAG TPA: GYD domain-containing protein [Anaerolineaceae bacterium]|nr:GYD domain-containing protein [Anaerolineaceae bacterium]
MFKVMLLMKLTTEGAKLCKEWPEMIETAISLGEQLGIKATAFYVGGAKYDYIEIGEMADLMAGELLRRYVMSGGYMEAYVVPLYEKDEFNKLIAAI